MGRRSRTNPLCEVCGIRGYFPDPDDSARERYCECIFGKYRRMDDTAWEVVHRVTRERDRLHAALQTAVGALETFGCEDPDCGCNFSTALLAARAALNDGA